MPVRSSTPRGGSVTRGGTRSATTRGGSRTSDPALRSFTGNRGTSEAQLREMLTEDARRNPNRSFLPTPVRVVLNAASAPAYTIGNLAAGDPAGAAQSLFTLGQTGPKTTVSQALRKHGLMPGGTLGTILGLGTDIATDPLTYVTFGGAGAARSAASSAARSVERQVLEKGRALTLGERARISATRGAEEAAAPGAVSVGLRVPFSRSRDIWLGETGAFHALGRWLGAKTPTTVKRAGQTTRERVGTSRGIDQVVNRVYQDTRRRAAVEANQLARGAQQLDREIKAAEKQLGLKRGQGGEAIARHLDTPDRYPLPTGLENVASTARQMLDDLDAAEVAAGLEKGRVSDYVPHLATPSTRETARRAFGQPTAATADMPFFTKTRETPDLDSFAAAGQRHGFTPELNIARLIESRARASVKARQKKAIDDAIVEVHGRRAPLEDVPGTGKQTGKLQAERERLTELMGPTPTGDLQATAAQTRQERTAAREALEAAQRTGDPAAVRDAQAQLARTEAQAAETAGVAPEAVGDVEGIGQRLSAAQAEARSASGALGRAQGARNGTPQQIASQGKRIQRLQDRVARARKAGRPVEPHLARLRDAQVRLAYLSRRQSLEEPRARVSAAGGEVAAATGDAADISRRLERARKVAEQRVERAQKRLAAAQKQGSTGAIRDARQALVRAQANARQARLALERARGTYVGQPRQVAAQTKRVLKAERSLVKAEKKAGAARLANELSEKRAGRIATEDEWKVALEEWREIGEATKYHEGVRLPPEIADDLDRVHALITPQVSSPAELAKGGRFLQNLTSRWKALALLSPGYHLRNLQDDGLRAWWAGARNPQSFVQATRILRSGKGTVTVGKGANRRTLTHDQFLDMARSEGVIDTGFVRADIESTEDLVRRSRLAGPGRGPVARVGRATGDWRENTTRLGTYLDLMKGGRNSTEAADRVRIFLFDYGETGAFVEGARRFWMPFVTFPSKAIPFTARQLATRPGTLANFAKAIEASNQLAGDPDLSYLPPWMQSAFAIPSTPAMRQLIGAPADQPLLLDPTRVTAMASLNLLDPRWSGIRQGPMGLLNPALKAAYEIPLNVSTFKGRSNYPGERVWAPAVVQALDRLGVPIAGFGPKKDPYTGEIGRGYDPRLDSLLRMLPLFGQQAAVVPARSEQTHLSALKWGLGIPLTPYDRARGAYFAEKFGR